MPPWCTIPADFSARATSFSENDADEAERATIEVQTSEVSGIADPVVGRAITAAATRALNTELTEQYLNGIYLGFNQLTEQFGTLADGAASSPTAPTSCPMGSPGRRPATGQLAGGLDELDAGAGQLAAGLQQLAEGTSELPAGTDRLADGARRLGRPGRAISPPARRSWPAAPRTWPVVRTTSPTD